MVPMVVLVLAACGPEAGPGAFVDRVVAVDIATDAPVARVDERFLSVAVDAGQVAGTVFWAEPGEDDPEAGVDPYDFARPGLAPWAEALAPAWLRVGGTDADILLYDLGDDPVETPPEGYGGVLTAAQWAGVADFAVAHDLRLLFTLNAGPGARGDAGAWDPANAAALLAHAAERGDPVGAWELGNEPNAFLLEYGVSLDPGQWGADLRVLAQLRDAHTPEAAVVGPAVAYWPLAGEMVPYTAEAVAAAGDALDRITWHYYPQQSERCPVATRPATPETLLDPDALDEVARWAAEVEAARDAGAPGAPAWLGETGNAQCGGQAGVSDRFASTFWWLDQLGLLARRGHEVVVRQTLSGADYGLLDDETLVPRPDAWASVLWRRTMGEDVLLATSADPVVRAWAHCARSGPPGAVTLLALNLDPSATVALDVPAFRAPVLQAWRLEAAGLDAAEVTLNGAALVVTADGSLPPLDGASVTGLVLPPRSIAFFTDPGAGAPACGG